MAPPIFPTPPSWGLPQHPHFTDETRMQKADSRPTAYTSPPSTLSSAHPTTPETRDPSLGPGTLPWDPKYNSLHISAFV